MQQSVPAVTPPYWPTSEKAFFFLFFQKYSFLIKCYCCRVTFWNANVEKEYCVEAWARGICGRECLPFRPFLLCWTDFIRWLVLFRFYFYSEYQLCSGGGLPWDLAQGNSGWSARSSLIMQNMWMMICSIKKKKKNRICGNTLCHVLICLFYRKFIENKIA